MTIASAISNAQSKIANAYIACEDLNATIPSTQNLSNLPNCIRSISGITPINANIYIEYPVTHGMYMTSVINSSNKLTSCTKDWILDNNGGNTQNIADIYFKNFTDVGDSVITNAIELPNTVYYYNVHFSDLINLSGFRALYNCFYFKYYICGIDFPNLKTITGAGALQYAFAQATNKIPTELSFDINFPELETVTGDYCLCGFINGCTHIKKVYFPKLTNFGTLKTQFDSFCSNYVSEIHFRADAENSIKLLNGYSSNFGAASLVFDL